MKTKSPCFRYVVGIAVAIGGSLFIASSVLAAQPQRPNVILMLADDLASDDLSCYGSERVETPRLDGLAKQGLRLTGYYAGNPVCSPSRMALLSGAYPARLGWRWGVLGYGFKPKTGMSSDVYTIAEAFRDAGYRTAMAGKWHVGSEAMAPNQQGFDSSSFIFMSNNQNRDMYRDGVLVREAWDNRMLTEAFAEEALRVIHEDSNKPFFLFVPWTAPHFPAEPHPDWHGKSGDDTSGEYTDVVEELDFRVGQILDALDNKDLAHNTIVVFTSDNGRQSGQQGPHDNPPFSGMKWQSLEGGTRVPCIVRFPGVIDANTTSNAMVSAIDLFPTLAEACGVKIELPQKAQKIDGVSVWKTFAGAPAVHARHEMLYWHGRGQATAIRVGPWKLVFNVGNENPKDPPLIDGPSLYNLDDDAKELNNLADQHPERVEAMLTRAKQLLTEIYANQVPLGTLEGVGPPDPPLKAEDVWGTGMR